MFLAAITMTVSPEIGRDRPIRSAICQPEFEEVACIMLLDIPVEPGQADNTTVVRRGRNISYIDYTNVKAGEGSLSEFALPIDVVMNLYQVLREQPGVRSPWL